MRMIEYDGHDGVTFQIDGHTFSPEDVMKLFSPYEGCELQFAIRDCGDSDAFTKVDFDTSDAIVIDCEKSKERKVKGYTVFKNAEKCSRDELTLIRQSWDENQHPVVIWSNKKLGKKVDDHLKWRALYFKGE